VFADLVTAAPAEYCEEQASEEEVRRDHDAAGAVVAQGGNCDPLSDADRHADEEGDGPDPGEQAQATPSDRGAPGTVEAVRNRRADQPSDGDKGDVERRAEGLLIVTDAERCAAGRPVEVERCEENAPDRCCLADAADGWQ
jgi:hypothetical protein